MNVRLISWGGLGAVALVAASGGAWMLSLPPSSLQKRNGIRIVPDQVAASWPADHRLPAIGDRQPARALDEALQGIGTRYGMRTADFVAMQLEYPRPGARQ